MPEEKGLLIVYTGPGKGKTTCALGTAFRAVGQGLRVLMVQFIKGSWHYGELDAAKMLGDDKFEIRPMGRGFVKIGGAETDPEDIKLAQECWEAGRDAIYGGKYDLVVLDEINYTISYKMLDAGESGGGAEKPAGARARDLHGAERASDAGGAGRPRYGDARGETPLHQGYTGAAGNRLLVSSAVAAPVMDLLAVLLVHATTTNRRLSTFSTLWPGSSETKNRSTQQRLRKSAACARKGCGPSASPAARLCFARIWKPTCTSARSANFISR